MDSAGNILWTDNAWKELRKIHSLQRSPGHIRYYDYTTNKYLLMKIPDSKTKKKIADVPGSSGFNVALPTSVVEHTRNTREAESQR